MPSKAETIKEWLYETLLLENAISKTKSQIAN